MGVARRCRATGINANMIHLQYDSPMIHHVYTFLCTAAVHVHNTLLNYELQLQLQFLQQQHRTQYCIFTFLVVHTYTFLIIHITHRIRISSEFRDYVHPCPHSQVNSGDVEMFPNGQPIRPGNTHPIINIDGTLGQPVFHI